MAVGKEDFEIVQYVTRACNGEIIGRMDRLGMHSLHWAAETSKKDLRVLQFLLDQYPGDISQIINALEKEDSWSILDYCIPRHI